VFGQIFSFQAISVWLGFVKNGFQFHSVINHFGFHIKRLVNAVFLRNTFQRLIKAFGFHPFRVVSVLRVISQVVRTFGSISDGLRYHKKTTEKSMFFQKSATFLLHKETTSC